MIKGENVTLRPLKIGDQSFFFKWLNDASVTNLIGFYLPLTESEEKDWVESYKQRHRHHEVFFMIEENGSSKAIGFCNISKIHPKNLSGEFMIVIGETDFWGKGFGTQAGLLLARYGFNELNMHRLSTGVYDFNARSLKSVQKLGFREEGRQREALYKNGKYHDVIMLGLLREDFSG